MGKDQIFPLISRKLDLDQIYRLVTTGTTAGMDGPCYTALRRAEFKRATEEGFLVAKRPPRGFGVLWFEWCRYHRHPSVTVQLKRRHATVGLDMFSTEALRLSKSAFRQV